MFLSKNYRLIVAPAEILSSYDKYLPEKRSFGVKYPSFKNIKYPRGNYQTDSSEILTLHCLYCSPLNFLPHASSIKTTRININRININPNDYYNPLIDYYNPAIDYFNPVIDNYNPVIDYYNLLLRFEPCLNQLGLILIRLIFILILDPVIIIIHNWALSRTLND